MSEQGEIDRERLARGLDEALGAPAPMTQDQYLDQFWQNLQLGMRPILDSDKGDWIWEYVWGSLPQTWTCRRCGLHPHIDQLTYLGDDLNKHASTYCTWTCQCGYIGIRKFGERQV